MNFWEQYSFDPNQPRVPAGSPEGGEWTAFLNSASKSARPQLSGPNATPEVQQSSVPHNVNRNSHAGKTGFSEGLSQLKPRSANPYLHEPARSEWFAGFDFAVEQRKLGFPKQVTPGYVPASALPPEA